MPVHQKKMSAEISRHINGTINASWSGNFLPVPAVRQVSWLTDHHTRPPSQSLRGSLSDCPVFFSDRAFAHDLVFPAHSDEIVQVFHLFPFYLLSACSHELFHSGSSTGCLFDCYGRYFSITEIIKTTEIVNDTIAISIYEREEADTSLICAKSADELLTISNITASFVIGNLGDKICISGRSIGDINVQLILEKLGGGGHITLAGAQVEGMTIEEVKQELIIRINEYFTEILN